MDETPSFNEKKQYINWNFVIKYINPKDPDDQDIPHRWMGFTLVSSVVYHIESVELIEDDGLSEVVFFIRGILRLSRRVSHRCLRVNLGISFEDDDVYSFSPFPGVLNSSSFSIHLPLEKRYNGFYREYGSRFIPRQGFRTDLVRDFIPVYPGPPTCLNKCKCCSVKFELQTKLELYQKEIEGLNDQLYELKTGRKRKR